jgi:hypothetical protein
MLFVTFHGGTASNSVNNVYAYQTGKGPQTKPLTKAVLNLLYPDQLSELRAIVFANNSLYVANGSKRTSNVLCFQGSGTAYHLASTFICGNVESINHPFSVAFDQAGHCFVSNQDTNVVAVFNVAAGGLSANPGPVASYLTGLGLKGSFLDATFVASKNGKLPNVPPTPPLEHGQGSLDVSFSGTGKDQKVQNSVRDVLLAEGVLFVVDEPGNCVRMYNPTTGTYLGNSTGALDSPTHLLLDPGATTLYVSAGKQIWSSPLPTSTTKPSLNFESIFTTKLGNIAGMAFDQASPVNSYIAIRTGTPQILMASATFQNPSAFIESLPDAPEFLRYVPG